MHFFERFFKMKSHKYMRPQFVQSQKKLKDYYGEYRENSENIIIVRVYDTGAFYIAPNPQKTVAQYYKKLHDEGYFLRYEDYLVPVEEFVKNENWNE